MGPPPFFGGSIIPFVAIIAARVRAAEAAAPTVVIDAVCRSALALIDASVGGTHSASDTPRRMSGMWSQCPWGSPALRRVSLPCCIYPTLAGVGGGVGRSRAPPLRRETVPVAIHPAVLRHRPLIRHGRRP